MIENVDVKFRVSRANLYHVPLRQWRKWAPQARQVFNELYSSMIGNQEIFLHPKTEALSRQKWKTVAWNASWIAAGATQDVL